MVRGTKVERGGIINVIEVMLL